MNDTRTFMSRTNRDRAWRKAQTEAIALERSTGVRTALRRTSSTNQQLHPQYVEDYTLETGHVLTAADKGFGNTIYKTRFAHLYHLEVRYLD